MRWVAYVAVFKSPLPPRFFFPRILFPRIICRFAVRRVRVAVQPGAEPRGGRGLQHLWLQARLRRPAGRAAHRAPGRRALPRRRLPGLRRRRRVRHKQWLLRPQRQVRESCGLLPMRTVSRRILVTAGRRLFFFFFFFFLLFFFSFFFSLPLLRFLFVVVADAGVLRHNSLSART